ncbi:hypothetical protein [Pelagimonas varians]|uniref:YMGG-like Gly-zipper domain-containing protein n=1 Tax=Pelagimonas varians TaxID=696760 RepID=A0A238KC13_9RHOB|nr:hypothetical protein [Pelagimonas varians]PYG30044.1 hypothetical protein C8N36_107211 [Pelagimonas varians]SMX40355.1 hypothetical protein PEV8663_01985 [Pelagimonas varians]
MQKHKWIAVALAFGTLAACGDTLGEQALVGAGAGGAAAVVLEQDALVGAAIGAAGNIAYCQKYPERC